MNIESIEAVACPATLNAHAQTSSWENPGLDTWWPCAHSSLPPWLFTQHSQIWLPPLQGNQPSRNSHCLLGERSSLTDTYLLLCIICEVDI